MDSPAAATGGGGGAMQSWWEGIARARDRIRALMQVLGPLNSLETLQESERPAKGLLEDEAVAKSIRFHLLQPNSGRGDDELCQWLYETYQTGDADLQAVVLRYVPTLCGVYLPRVCSNGSEPVAGFEAVLLALYTAEVKTRGGRPLVVHIPDLSQPSLYHAPRVASNAASARPRVGHLAAPLEPQMAVKATKRAGIVSVALDLFCRKIATMPKKAKIEACRCAEWWAGPFCSWAARSQENVVALPPVSDAMALACADSQESLEGDNINGLASPSRPISEIEIAGVADQHFGHKHLHHQTSAFHLRQDGNAEALPSPKRAPSSSPSPTRMHAIDGSPQSNRHGQYNSLSHVPEDGKSEIPNGGVTEAISGVRIQLPWELLQPLLKILGHCLMAPLNPPGVRDAASAAIRALHYRVSRDLIPQAILATRSLMQLDLAGRAVAKAAATSASSTPSKPRKPEILLVSK